MCERSDSGWLGYWWVAHTACSSNFKRFQFQASCVKIEGAWHHWCWFHHAGSTHYQAGQYKVVILEGTQSAVVRIPVLHENIEGSVEFLAVLQRCEHSQPELTAVAFVAPNTVRVVVLSQQTKPSESHDVT